MEVNEVVSRSQADGLGLTGDRAQKGTLGKATLVNRGAMGRREQREPPASAGGRQPRRNTEGVQTSKT